MKAPHRVTSTFRACYSITERDETVTPPTGSTAKRTRDAAFARSAVSRPALGHKGHRRSLRMQVGRRTLSSWHRIPPSGRFRVIGGVEPGQNCDRLPKGLARGRAILRRSTAADLAPGPRPRSRARAIAACPVVACRREGNYGTTRVPEPQMPRVPRDHRAYRAPCAGPSRSRSCVYGLQPRD